MVRPPAQPETQDRRRRRAPDADERQRDAERSRQRLLTAALEEFSAHGYAGARVGTIAARAGLNPQLITYYFGGKAGLYRELTQRWLDQEATIYQPDASLEDLAIGYLHATIDDPRMARLLLWEGLSHANRPDHDVNDETAQREDLSDLQRRQDNGEIAEDLDVAMFQLALMGATLAPVAIPHVVRRITGLDPSDPDFVTRYGKQIRRILRHLTR
jgi:TetR/AcrR family transcriptional regulator